VKVNLYQEFTGRLDVAAALGAAESAMFLYDVDPGDSFPYHFEYEQELGRGDLVRFPPGPLGAHQIMNRGQATARALLFSDAAVPAISVYPDSDTIGVWPDDDTEFYFKRSTAVTRDAVD